MSAPWLKFYPSDWRSDPRLRLCSLEARGLWMELVCLMHEAEPYGHATMSGAPLTDRQLGALAGVSAKDAARLLGELDQAGVFSRTDGGVIFSRRMVRDGEKAAADKANGSKGGNPGLKRGVNPPDKPRGKGQDKAQKPEARSQSSDADASAHERDEADPDAQAWALAVVLLTRRAGLSERQARAFFGGLLKRQSVRASELYVALIHAEEAGTPDLQPYLTQAAQNLRTPRLIHDRGPRQSPGSDKLHAVAGAMRAAFGPG